MVMVGGHLRVVDPGDGATAGLEGHEVEDEPDEDDEGVVGVAVLRSEHRPAAGDVSRRAPAHEEERVGK